MLLCSLAKMCGCRFESTSYPHFTDGRRYAGVTAAVRDKAGPIPKELGVLTALRVLELDNNKLEGVTRWDG